MVFMFYRVYHISYKKEVPIMDADMKSFLYSAHSIILFPISFLFPCKSIFGKRFRFVTLKMAANKTVSTINFPLSPHLSVTANIGYAHSLNIFCKTLRLTHVFPFRKTLFQKHLFCNTLFNGIFIKFNKNREKKRKNTGFKQKRGLDIYQSLCYTSVVNVL